jgi:hypothetical protein
MYIALILKRRLKLMIKWVRNGLILLATLSLLVVGQDKLFPPPVGKIPDGVISHRKATQDEKNYNKKLAKDYAQAGFGWSGREWECLLSLGPVKAGLITTQRTNEVVQLTELLNYLERKIAEANIKSLEVLNTLNTDTTHLVEPTNFGSTQDPVTTKL